MDQKTQVTYYTTSQGKNPVSDFLDSLPQKQQAKILRILQYIGKYGISSVLPHIRKLTGTPLWEIRILGKDNLRVLYVMPNKNIVLALHGFVKKKQKTPQKEMEIALSRLKDWQLRKG